ncbi:MAG: PQQ-binding-like beta-propeller repeat protein, partial [Nitrososphaerales archaeon]
PIIAYGAVWAVSISNNTFFAVNPANGSLLFQTTLNPVEHFTTPSAGGGLVYIAANETVYALNP